MEMADGLLSPGAAVLAIAVMAVVMAVFMLRRNHRRHMSGWVPWNGILFAAIVIGAIAAAHLLGVQQR
jgi:hypothetical protein